MHIHILGICGTFMGSLAILAKELGHRVTGCDQAVYPPMSTQLEAQGIELISGFDPEQLDLAPDLFVIGNAISRGNPLLEAILNQGLAYTSGPGLLASKVLPGKWVLAVAGTHGKTTTASMLAWILEYAGMQPGFLIGGVPGNFECSARLGETPFFVIEADEYDSAFFDKRSKFVHYRPRTFIFNNLEYDHADIFPDLAAIQTQFHHVIRTIPENGRVIYPAGVDAIDEVLAQGLWCESQAYLESGCKHDPDINSDPDSDLDQPSWALLQADGSAFECRLGKQRATIQWSLSGTHNVCNGVSALLAARHVGVELGLGAEALCAFAGVKRRMECIAEIAGVKVYDDFAHHPTAIASTLDGLRKQVGSEQIIALIEPRSNTMRMGVHEAALMNSAETADHVVWADLSSMPWLQPLVEKASDKHLLGLDVETLIKLVCDNLATTAHVVVMSNGGFAGIHTLLTTAIAAKEGAK